MTKKIVAGLVNRYGAWRIAQALLFVVAAALIMTALLILLTPLKNATLAVDAPVGGRLSPRNSSEPIGENPPSADVLLKTMRNGLFKSASAVRDNPMADKTIERIRSQLKLQSVVEINGQQVAYVKINNVGLRKCAIGETVEDMFTVLDIQEKRVEVSIIGHTIVLRP
jgi:hypothetical protein